MRHLSPHFESDDSHLRLNHLTAAKNVEFSQKDVSDEKSLQVAIWRATAMHSRS